MSYQTYPPHSALTRYIKCHWSLRYDNDREGRAGPAGYSVLAEGAELLFHQSGAVLFGPMSRPIKITLAGRGTLWGGCFRAGGASSFVDTPARQLQNSCVAAIDVWGRQARQRFDQIQDAHGTPKETIDHLNRFLLCRLRQHRRPGVDLMKSENF